MSQLSPGFQSFVRDYHDGSSNFWCTAFEYFSHGAETLGIETTSCRRFSLILYARKSQPINSTRLCRTAAANDFKCLAKFCFVWVFSNWFDCISRQCGRVQLLTNANLKVHLFLMFDHFVWPLEIVIFIFFSAMSYITLRKWISL